MKKAFFPRILLFMLLVVAASCQSRVVLRQPYPGNSSTKGLPPGQAKKVYGHQSAKAFAPGQQKKYHSPGNDHKSRKGKKKK